MVAEVRECRSMAAARARGGGDVREKAPHGENENGLERKKKRKWSWMGNGFLTFKSLRSGSRMKRKKKKIKEKSFRGKKKRWEMKN